MTPEQIAEIDEAWRPGHASILAQLIKHGAHNLKEHPEPVIVHGCTVIPAASLKEAVRVVWFGVPALLAEVERLTAQRDRIREILTDARNTPGRLAAAIGRIAAVVDDGEPTC